VFLDQFIKIAGLQPVLCTEQHSVSVAGLQGKPQGAVVQKISISHGFIDSHLAPFFFGAGFLKPSGGRAPTLMKYSSAVMFLGATATENDFPVRYCVMASFVEQNDFVIETF
jgi:hypothetical protein